LNVGFRGEQDKGMDSSAESGVHGHAEKLTHRPKNQNCEF
jgi:hypothetical protein